MVFYWYRIRFCYGELSVTASLYAKIESSWLVCLCLPFLQVCLGSGWALEPYEGSGSRTLVSYIAHVSDGHITYA